MELEEQTPVEAFKTRYKSWEAANREDAAYVIRELLWEAYVDSRELWLAHIDGPKPLVHPKADA